MHIKAYSVKFANNLREYSIHINEVHMVICSNDSNVNFPLGIMLILGDIPLKI